MPGGLLCSTVTNQILFGYTLSICYTPSIGVAGFLAIKEFGDSITWDEPLGCPRARRVRCLALLNWMFITSSSLKGLGAAGAPPTLRALLSREILGDNTVCMTYELEYLLAR